MKAKRIQIQASGFTLIELLVVIGMISILLMMSLPGITKAVRKSREYRARATAKRMADGIKTYTLDTGMFPLQAAAYTYDTRFEDMEDCFCYNNNAATYEALCQVLAEYINLAKMDMDGDRIVDPWDNNYYVCADWNFDGFVAFREDHGDADPPVEHSVLVWSVGPNEEQDYGENEALEQQYGGTGADGTDDIYASSDFYTSGRGIRYQITARKNPQGFNGTTGFTLELWTRHLSIKLPVINGETPEPEYTFYKEVIND